MEQRKPLTENIRGRKSIMNHRPPGGLAPRIQAVNLTEMVEEGYGQRQRNKKDQRIIFPAPGIYLQLTLARRVCTLTLIREREAFCRDRCKLTSCFGLRFSFFQRGVIFCMTSRSYEKNGHFIPCILLYFISSTYERTTYIYHVSQEQ